MASATTAPSSRLSRAAARRAAARPVSALGPPPGPLMFRSLCLAGALACSALPAAAQPIGDAAQDAPARVRDIVALGRGGTRLAAPTLESPFFSNPAHLTAEPGVRFTVLGVTTGLGGNVRETYDFYDTTLGPAIDQGLDDLSDSDPERLREIYDEALRIGRSQKTAQVAVLAPSVRVNRGAFAVGGGLFSSVVSRAVIDARSGAGIPFIDAYAQGDLLAPLAAAAPVPTGSLPVGSVSVGASATFLRRYVTAKAKPVDAIATSGETVFLLAGNTVRAGLGAYARDVYVPGVDLGLSLTNIGGTVDYELDREWVLDESDQAELSAAERAAIEAGRVAEREALTARFEERAARPVFRAGAAYRVPLEASRQLPLADVLVALDYTSHSTSASEQSMQAGLRAGVSGTVGGVLGLSTGLSQGMLSAGVGLRSRVARLDFATYGVEDGRLLGQAQRRAYALQLRFGRF